MLVSVSTSLNIYETLTYSYTGNPEFLKPGLRVVIPMNNRLTVGWITNITSDYKGRVKEIIAIVHDDYCPSLQSLSFVQSISDLYFTSMGSLLDATLPPQHKPIGSLYFENKSNNKIERLNRYSLLQLQQWSKKEIIECVYKSNKSRLSENDEIETPQFETRRDIEAFTKSNSLDSSEEASGTHLFLIGYHREEYYLQRCQELLSHNRSVLIIVPDNTNAAYFQNQFICNEITVDLYNSTMTPKERDKIWREYAIEKKAGVLIGGQSAVLLPIQNLGLIICEASGSSIYKHPYFSPYNVQLLSKLRAKHFQLPFVEGYSCPTVQARQPSTPITLQDDRGPSIPVNVIPIKKDTRGIPAEIHEMVSNYLSEDKKILVLLNKKEGVHFLYCDKCKKPQKCPSCAGYIQVEGETDFHITCHRCKKEFDHYNQCPKCGEQLAIIEDISVSSMKKFLKGQISSADLTSISSEGLKEDHIHTVLSRIDASKIIIATPVVVNPYFKNIFDAVIYLRPESLFNLEKYDAAEKVFSLISELREIVKPEGTIDIFSTFHFHYSLRLIDNETGFFERELRYREWFRLPPFFNVYHIEVRGTELRKLAITMRKIYREFKESFKIEKNGVYLTNREPLKGKYKFKGILEAHVNSEDINASGLLKNRDITIHLVIT